MNEALIAELETAARIVMVYTNATQRAGRNI